MSLDCVEEINDNDEFFGKIRPAVRAVRGPGDPAERPAVPGPAHAFTGLRPRPRVHRAVAAGITGIACNRRKLGSEIRHMQDFWASDLRGRVTLISGLDGVRPDARAAGDRAGRHVEGAGGVREALARERGVVTAVGCGGEGGLWHAGLRLGSDQPGVVRRDHGLDAVAGPDLGEDG
jgi:hypothetical protein